jgi:NCS1 family nucleobase:cation symporter-1
MIVGGLSWWQSWICVWIGYFIAASFVCLTGRIGAVYHISFPVTARASFGIWGSFWPVINRVVMAIIWYGVQAYIGGMLSSISPHSHPFLTHSRRVRHFDDRGNLAQL